MNTILTWLKERKQDFDFIRLTAYVAWMQTNKRWHYFRNLPDWFVDTWCQYGDYTPEDERDETYIAIWREAQAEQQLRIAREAPT